MKPPKFGGKETAVIYRLHYSVPVDLDLDGETGTVLDVTVADEDLVGPQSAHDEAGRQLGREETQRLAAIADEADWPAWSFGA